MVLHDLASENSTVHLDTVIKWPPWRSLEVNCFCPRTHVRFNGTKVQSEQLLGCIYLNYIHGQAALMIVSSFYMFLYLFESGFTPRKMWTEGNVSAFLEAKNHICSNRGVQPVSQSLIEAGTKLNCVTFEWSLGNQPALGVEEVCRRSTRHSGQELVMRSRHSRKSQKDLFSVSSRANEGHRLSAECLFRARRHEARLIGTDVTFWMGEGSGDDRKSKRKSFSHFYQVLCVLFEKCQAGKDCWCERFVFASDVSA